MWLSGSGVVLQSERSLVRFPVGACAWVVGSAPDWGVYERSKSEVGSFPNTTYKN